MKTHCLQHKDLVIAWYESSKLRVRIILALGTNHLNSGYESSGFETSVGTKRPVIREISAKIDDVCSRLASVFIRLICNRVQNQDK